MQQLLPELVVERIFATMRGTYGVSFDRQWEPPPDRSPAQHLAELRRFWAQELAAWADDVDAISWALSHLPPKPPNLLEFRALCARRPEPIRAAEPAQPVSPARMRRVLEKLRTLGAEKASKDPRAWARRLQAHELRGSEMSRLQRKLWREALGFAPGCTAESTVRDVMREAA
jgi:hypothetical protein